MEPELAGKITGMLLHSMKPDAVEALLRAGPDALAGKVIEAKRLLEGHEAAVRAADHHLVA
jgi:hypothetical protein